MLASSTTDWITAIGSVFAAVGTVGAVIIALWQTRRRDKYKVHVSCNMSLTGDAEIGNLVSLQATNIGKRMVKLRRVGKDPKATLGLFDGLYEPAIWSGCARGRGPD